MSTQVVVNQAEGPLPQQLKCKGRCDRLDREYYWNAPGVGVLEHNCTIVRGVRKLRPTQR